MNWKALRNAPVVVLIAAMLVAGCSESKLPAATGKASLRAINAVVTAPEVSFLIEERFLHSVAYRQLSSSSRFDDLSYSFNFDVRYAGETESQRIASTFVEVVPDLDYVFVLA